jgi:hypothetical protein
MTASTNYITKSQPKKAAQSLSLSFNFRNNFLLFSQQQKNWEMFVFSNANSTNFSIFWENFDITKLTEETQLRILKMFPFHSQALLLNFGDLEVKVSLVKLIFCEFFSKVTNV